MKLGLWGASTAISFLTAWLLAGMLTAGCRSPNRDISDRMASIVVTNRPSKDIEAAIRSVFDNNGYVEGRSENDILVFEKKGSFMSGVVYSDWYSGGVWERIKVYQRDLDENRTVVECDGYMVKEHEDPLFAQEKREYKTKRGHCQKFMDEVAMELAKPSGNSQH
jgi:hypothetical protein